MSGDYGSDFVCAKCIADKGMVSPSLAMLLGEPQAELLHPFDRLGGADLCPGSGRRAPS